MSTALSKGIQRADEQTDTHALDESGVRPVPTPVYVQTLSTLARQIGVSRAREVLDDALDAVGVSPDRAFAYDLRSVLLDELPQRLGQHLSQPRVQRMLRLVEEALVELHHSSTPPANTFTVSTVPPREKGLSGGRR